MQIVYFLLAGALLVMMAFAGRWVERLPLSPALAYLAVGYALGPAGVGVFAFDLRQHAASVELLTETAVLISLFAVGLRLRIAPTAAGWRVALRLAGVGMALTTALAAVAAYALLGLEAAAALLLAAVLAPTDPVLASDVQVHEPGDRDALRLSLTAEGGLNDGMAFPAVMLALGLFGVHSIGAWGWRWVAVDLLWAVGAALAIGWACGWGTGRLLAQLRRSEHLPRNEEFLVLGLIALTYGLTLLLKAYGFVAVFVAALALAHAERSAGAPQDAGDDATHSRRLLHFTGQCERLLEMVVVLAIGVLLAGVQWEWRLLGFAVVMLAVVRPLAVLAVVPRHALPQAQRRLVAWFGIRGIGTVYYIAYAIHHGVPWVDAGRVVDAALVTIALSVLLHGVSATPVLEHYRQHRERRRSRVRAARH